MRQRDSSAISRGFGGTYYFEVSEDWCIIAVDETDLPAIGTLLDFMPPSMRVYVLAEVRDQKGELASESTADNSTLW